MSRESEQIMEERSPRSWRFRFTTNARHVHDDYSSVTSRAVSQNTRGDRRKNN